MTEERILGYTWADIQRAQQGGSLHKRLKLDNSPPAWTDADAALLAQHKTADGLSAAGFHGTADRVRRLGKG